MSYGVSMALQAAVYQTLSSDGALTALVGDAIYDAVPAGLVSGTYVSLGPEEVEDRSDISGAGALHQFTISVISDQAGFLLAKEVAAAVNDCLLNGGVALTRGRLVYLNFQRAVARRVKDADMRRIDLIFRARVDDDQI